MNPRLKAFSEYIRTIEERLATGVAAEGTHYAALQTLLEQLRPDVKAKLLPHCIDGLTPDQDLIPQQLLSWDEYT